MISTELAALARNRSHVSQPCSRKKPNPAKEAVKAANITAMPGTACSAPFAPGNPSATSESRKSGFMNPIIKRGMSSRNTMMDGSSAITLNS